MYFNYNLNNLHNYIKYVGLENELYGTQYDAAKEIVGNFLFQKRYGFLKAKTQSGKTGVFCALVNILKFYKKINSTLNINTVFFITGDNQDIKEQAEKDYNESCIQKSLPVKFLKNSDLKKNFFSLKNCLIVIDESHFGTSKKKNILPTFLKKGGLNYMKNDECMEQNNAYIVSVSATPWKELANDKFGTKFIVELETTNEYKGFEEFDNNKQICTLYDKSILKDEIMCGTFFSIEVLEYLKDLEEKTKRKHFVIVRNLGRGGLDITNDIIGDNYHIITIVGKDNQKVPYHDMYEAIDDICIDRDKYKNKYLLVVIKGSFKMGKRFKLKYKDYCGVCVDYSDNDKNVETTEQGLLGRFSGYITKRKIKDAWKNTRFYISKTHYDMIKNYYERSDYMTPYDFNNEEESKKHRRFRKVWGVGDMYGVNNDLFPINGIKEFNVTQYFYDKQDILDRISDYENKLKRNELYGLVQDIIKNSEEIDNKYLEYMNCGCRRVPSKNEKFAEINYADGGKNWENLRDPKNYLRPVKKTTLITTDKNNVILRIQESIIDKYTPIDTLMNGVKEIETYKTVEQTFEFNLPINNTKIEVLAS